jgi:FixJ family two-component response regulator
MSAPLVFVVDDDPSARRGIARLLGATGHRVEEYDSPTEFLSRTSHDGACCLVLDLRMPGMSGLELQEALLASGHDIPIVFVTGHGDVPASVRAMKGGAVDFLLKPFSGDELLASVAAALARARDRSHAREERDELTARWSTLTPRERQVMVLVVDGLLNKQVASRLEIRETTVKAHRAKVMEKMGAGSLAELVRMAEHMGSRLAPSEPAD